MMQNFGNRSVQKYAQNAGSNVLKDDQFCDLHTFLYEPSIFKILRQISVFLVNLDFTMPINFIQLKKWGKIPYNKQ